MLDTSQEKNLFDRSIVPKHEPVEVFGMVFDNDEERRRYFSAELRKKLRDPEFRKFAGFPMGSDESILSLSDPPFYTACPNPFINDFIKLYGRPYDSSESYSREPFAADVSEGKNDPIYNAHAYHTKVPYKAIMRYILHYTEPGDIVFDGFCGTGMTGVAADMCGNRAVVESLGFRVDNDGTIFRQAVDENGKTFWEPFSKLGIRRAVLNDLSPVATFIAYNFNSPVDVNRFSDEARRILREVNDECGWMYETMHTDGKTKGKINYTVWSDVFVCPECTHEVVFYDVALDKMTGKVKDKFACPHCSVNLTKRRMDRAWVTIFDKALNKTIRQAKQVPVLINYSVYGQRAEKVPDADDIALIRKIEDSEIPYWYPSAALPDGHNTRQPIRSHGYDHVHHFYTKRNLWVLAALYNKALRSRHKLSVFFVQYATMGFSKLARYVPTHYSQVNRYLSGTLYVASQQVEVSPEYILSGKLERLVKREAPLFGMGRGSLIGCIDSSRSPVPNNSIDYIFIDPPFGSNLNYSELNFIWEQWLQVLTNNEPEAIENAAQGKGLNEYRRIMTACFSEAYRILKPGRWITITFSNTKASVWNAIQTALADAGFIVANVSALDKKQRTFKAVTTPTAVKQDLVISAYKPNGGFEVRFQEVASTEEGVWDFVRTHLKYLPIVKRGAGTERLITIPERDPRILYDQMVAYFIRKGYPVPLNSAEFQDGLAQRFSYRDGMFFLPEQVAEYDKCRLVAGEAEQMSLFVSDESSAIAWLRQYLKEKPSTFQDIHPLFIKELAGWHKHEKPLELSELLTQNFLQYDGQDEVPSQIHSYLSTNYRELRNLSKDDERLRARARDRWYVPDPKKASDLEKLRERSLLKQFQEYSASSSRRLTVFRLEAVRAGFKKAWQERDYTTIISVARKIPENVLQEDPQLLMWYDQAVTRTGAD